ncbi:MAG: lysophospholipid acyltransferase family protein [Ignavibacteria bacterium]
MWLVKNIVFALYSILIAVLVLIFTPIDYKKYISFILLKSWTNGILILYGVKVKITGGENITSHEGKVYISNHASYLDIYVLLAKLPDNVRILYKKELNKMILISWAMRACGFVPIDRDNVRDAMKSLDKAAEKIRKGLSFVIFPEGTRSKDGSVQEFKRGGALVTEKAKVNVVPVSISNTNNLMPIGSNRIKSGRVNLVIGKPMEFKKEKSFLNEVRDEVVKNANRQS